MRIIIVLTWHVQVLGLPLDKQQQRSDWSARPLSEKQRRYAAADAHVLVCILDRALGAGHLMSPGPHPSPHPGGAALGDSTHPSPPPQSGDGKLRPGHSSSSRSCAAGLLASIVAQAGPPGDADFGEAAAAAAAAIFCALPL